MLRHSFITPAKYIDTFKNRSSFMLTLSHLIELNGEPNKYTQAIIDSGKDIYLDNGVFENGKPEGIDVLVDKLYYLQSLGAKPKVVFLPDELYNKEATLNNLIEWNKRYSTTIRDRCKTISCVVVQGSNHKEFIEFIEEIRAMGVGRIALSYLACVKCFKEITGTEDVAINRIEALKHVISRGFLRVHLLGLGNSLKDIKYAKDNYDSVTFDITNDSSSAFMTGIRGISYNNNGTIPGGKIKEKVNFDMEDELSDKQIKNINKNMIFINNL